MTDEAATEAELHTLTGAYATNALPDAEREAFERHLDVCAACSSEVAELQATAGRLGLAVSTPTPPEMRAQVLRRIADVRQEPPRVSVEDVPSGRGRTQDQAEGQGQDAHRERDRYDDRDGYRDRVEDRNRDRDGGRDQYGGRGRDEPRRSVRSTARARALPRFALAACLALAAAAGGVAAWQYQEAQDVRQQAEESRQRQEELMGVLAAPDARTTGRNELPGGASGSVVVSRDRDRAAFLASGMDAPPSGKVYQLWFADGGKMRSAGLMDSPGDSRAVLMEGKVGRASAMGVTVEPAGGSQQPTTRPLALMKLPGAA